MSEANACWLCPAALRSSASRLVRLTTHEDGTAIGPVIGHASFMRLREHVTPFSHAARSANLVEASLTATETVHDPARP